jgi:hypothetical protein
MLIVRARRASAILFRLARAMPTPGVFLMPANVCHVVPLTVRRAGHGIRLVDIAEPELDIDRQRVREIARDPLVRGVVYVHPYGACQEVVSFFGELKSLRPELLLVDDRCLCRPEVEGPAPTTAADATLYSTGCGKYLDLDGGGFAFLREGVRYRPGRERFSPPAARDLERRFRSALDCRRAFRGGRGAWLDLRGAPDSWPAYRNRISEKLPAVDEHKRRLNAIYNAHLATACLPDPYHAWRFQVRLPRAGAALAEIVATGLFASRHYASLGGVLFPGRYSVAERLAADVLNLFNDHHFDEEQAARAASLVYRHLAVGRI